MSAFWLKIMAIVAMTCDHISATMGIYYFPLRYIGRLTMPIMCFLIAEGYRHTRDPKKYLGRLFLFGLVSEIPFDLAFYWSPVNFLHQNVFFTLVLGLLGIYLYEKYRHGMAGLFFVLCGMAAELLNTDYGFYGVILIAGFYLWGKDFRGILLVLVATNLFFFLGTIQMYSALAFIPLAFYNGERGPSMKYFFYIFYPAHLLLLYGLARFVVFA